MPIVMLAAGLGATLAPPTAASLIRQAAALEQAATQPAAWKKVLERYQAVIDRAVEEEDLPALVQGGAGYARALFKTGDTLTAWQEYLLADGILEREGVFGKDPPNERILVRWGLAAIPESWKTTVTDLTHTGYLLLGLDREKLSRNGLALPSTPPLGWGHERERLRREHPVRMIAVWPLGPGRSLIARPDHFEHMISGGGGAPPPGR